MRLIRLLTATAILVGAFAIPAVAGIDGAYLQIRAAERTVEVPPADEIACYEDAVKVLVVWDVAPDNGVPPDLDWEPADGRMMCATFTELYTLD